MTNARPDKRPKQDKTDLLSALVARKPAAGLSDQPVNLHPFQSILVAGHLALTTIVTRRALRGLERDRSRDIGVERRDIDRAARNAAQQASETLARRFKGRRWSTVQATSFVNRGRDDLMRAGRMSVPFSIRVVSTTHRIDRTANMAGSCVIGCPQSALVPAATSRARQKRTRAA